MRRLTFGRGQSTFISFRPAAFAPGFVFAVRQKDKVQ
jgi:hypothetical protein